MNNTAWDCQYCNKNHNWAQDPCLELLDFWNSVELTYETVRTKRRKDKV